MEDYILDVENLEVGFHQYTKGLKRRKITVVHDCNIQVKRNEIYAIFGASGSGKSLLAHAILGLLPRNAVVSGKMLYNQQEINEELMHEALKQSIAFIPQTIHSLNPLLKIKQQLFLYPDSYQEELAFSLCDRFNLDHSILEKYPHECSGGMARRVLVMIAMAKNADFILADEPTPGMDEAALLETIAFFKEIKDAGKSALIISHDMETLLQVADRIGIFYEGKIIEVKPRSCFNNQGEGLEHPYSKALFQALPEQGFHLANWEEIQRKEEIK